MAEEVIVHHGASIAVSGLDKADEAFLAALVRGEFGVDDAEDTGKQLVQRARLMHAFLADPESIEIARVCLDAFGVDPDAEVVIRAMVSGWLRELYGAAPFPSASAVGDPPARWHGSSSGSTYWPLRNARQPSEACTTAWSLRGSCLRTRGPTA